jgi:hypothetical protein
MPKAKKTKPSLPFHSDLIRVGVEKKLSHYEVLFLHTLRAGMNKDNTKNWRSQRRLAEETRFSLRKIVEVVKSLERKKLIKVGRHQGKHCIYELNIKKTYARRAQGCAQPAQVGTHTVHRGCAQRAQGGMHSVHPNKVSRIRQNNKSNELSSLIAGNDDNKIIINNNSNSDCQPENNDVSSGKVEKKGVASAGKDSKRLAEELEEATRLLVEAKGKRFAKAAGYFADDIIQRKEIDHALPYKIKILQSVLAGERPDFDLGKVEQKMRNEIEDSEWGAKYAVGIALGNQESRKDRRLVKSVYAPLRKRGDGIKDALIHLNIIDFATGDLLTESFKNYIRNLRVTGRIKKGESIKAVVNKLDKAIRKDAGV